MQVTAKLRYLHMSPRKVRRVATLITGMPVPSAEAELSARHELSSVPIEKLLKSAVANGTSLTEASAEQMTVVSCSVNDGPVMKRWRPRSRGMAHPYKKRMSHVTIVLDVPGDKKKEDKLDTPVKAEEASKHADHVDHEHDNESAPKKSGFKPGGRGEARKQKQRTSAPRSMKRFFQRKSI